MGFGGVIHHQRHRLAFDVNHGDNADFKEEGINGSFRRQQHHNVFSQKDHVSRIGGRERKADQAEPDDDGKRAHRTEAHKVARSLTNRCVQPLADRAEAEESPEPSAFAGASPSPARVDLDGPRSGSDKKKLCKMCKERAGERLFSEKEVREIVQKELSKREKELEDTYNEVLQNRLAEQYHNFCRFHEDCVSRQLNQSDYSYMT